MHGHYLNQARIAPHVDWVYDFALPPLMLHTLYTRERDQPAEVDGRGHQAGQLHHRARHGGWHRRAGALAPAGRWG